MIEKGLTRIGRPISDISNAMQNQGQLEVSKLEKNLNILASASGAAPMLGFLGTVVGMIMAFSKFLMLREQFLLNFGIGNLYCDGYYCSRFYLWEFQPIFSIIFW